MINALQHFQADLMGRSVLVQTDNTTVVAYINRQGGTRSPRLCFKTWDMFQWVVRNRIDLHATHVPGPDNRVADALSRGKIVPTEWTLHSNVVHQIFQYHEQPLIDLFATAENTQLLVFCARYYHPKAWATDALSLDWTNMYAYAFPPISLLPRVIGKVERSLCKILLIAPFWPRQPWFVRLVRLLVGPPLILPARPDLLFQPSSGILHPAPVDLHLTCWPLSKDPSARRAFLRTLPPWLHEAAALPHGRCTTAGFDIITDGVGNAQWIRSLLL